MFAISRSPVPSFQPRPLFEPAGEFGRTFQKSALLSASLSCRAGQEREEIRRYAMSSIQNKALCYIQHTNITPMQFSSAQRLARKASLLSCKAPGRIVQQNIKKPLAISLFLGYNTKVRVRTVLSLRGKG
jgi:hypothetical protein